MQPGAMSIATVRMMPTACRAATIVAESKASSR